MSKKRRTAGLIVLIVALAALASAGSLAGRAQTRPEVIEEFHQTYPLSAGGRVELSNINGKVSITGWDRSEVKVDAVKRAYKPERLREVEIRVNATANGVEIETDYEERTIQMRNSEREDQFARVDFTIMVPRGARLEEVNLVNGPLVIEGLGGPVQASSVNGRVTARGLTGQTKLSVVNGHLEANFDRLEAPVTLSSVNGLIDLVIPSDANAHVRASTLSGQIKNDFGLPVRNGDYVGRDLEGRIGSGATRVTLSNVGGVISIRRAADGRPQSPATNLLSETPGGDDDDDADDDNAQERRSNRETMREARRAAREEAARIKRETREEVRREAVEGARERVRNPPDPAQIGDEVAREIERAAERSARAAERISREVNNEIAKGIPHGGAPRRIERESNTLPAPGTPRIRLETFDGPVNVHAWDKSEVMYTAVKRAHDEREMQGIKVQARGGQEISIRAEFDKAFAREVNERQGRVVSFSSGASCEFDVYVPRNATLVLSTGDGGVSVEGVSGDLNLHTGDGPVAVTGGSGRVVAETGDGRIRIENFDGEAEARTGDGRISLEGRFQKLSARTGDGTISLALAEGVNANLETEATSVVNEGLAVAEDSAGDGRLRRWRVGSGGQTFTLRTGDGQIILRRR